MQVQLVMFKSDGTRREFTLRKEVTIIGRAVECDFQIPIAAVSRSHAEITVREDHIAVRDMGSSNGTFVNGSRVQQSDLEPGDKLVIGPITFSVLVDGQPADVDPVRSVAGVGATFELEEGTVDVEAQTEQRTASNVKIPAKAKKESPTKSQPVKEKKVVVVEEIEEINYEFPGESDHRAGDEAPAANDPLAALQALTRPKEEK